MDLLGLQGLLALSVLVSGAAIPIVRQAADRMGLMDRPSGRKVHCSPVPIVGGVGVFLALVCGAVVVAVANPDRVFPASRPIIALAGAALFLFLLGLWDDRRDLSARRKFAGQIGACSIAVLGGVVLTRVSFPGGPTIELGWLGYPLTLFWLLGAINAMNLIDGLDGLAAGIVAQAAAALSALSIAQGFVFLAVPSMLVLGSTLGFLPYNLSRWKTYLGDGGSTLLGFLLAGTVVLAANWGMGAGPVIICVAFLTIPILDVVTTIARRLRTGRPVLEADSWHLHHRLLRLGISPRKTLVLLLTLNGLFGSLGIAFALDFLAVPLIMIPGAVAVILAEIHRYCRASSPYRRVTVRDTLAFLLLGDHRGIPSFARPTFEAMGRIPSQQEASEYSL